MTYGYKTYVIILGTQFERRSDVQDFLNGMREVSYWYGVLPRCIFCTSSLSANELSNRIIKKFPDKEFLVMEASENRQGWLPKDAWHLLSNPNDPEYKEKK